MKLVVFDVGGTDIKYSVMDETLTREKTGSVPTCRKDQPSFLKQLKGIYDEIGEGTEGITVSMPGMIDDKTGYCYTGGTLDFNQGTPVADLLSEMCGCPVHIDNDGKCAAYAEFSAGSLKGCSNAAVFLIGTGAGGGLIINGKLVRGKHFSAGEFSFLSRGLKEWGTLEGLLGVSAATTGFLMEMRKAKNMSAEEPLDGRIAFRMINDGDPVACKVLDDFTYGIAHEIYNLQMLLDIERIAIGGGISREDKLIESLKRSYIKLFDDAYEGLHGLTSPVVEIVRCTFSSEANQIGAFKEYIEWWEEKNG